MYLGWLLVPVICLGGWQLAVWLGETRDKKKRYQAARTYALERSKPLLIAGGPWGNKQARRLLKMPAHGSGDVCLDINPNAMNGHPNGVIANVTHIPFADKSFGAAFASHLLEHVPNTDDAKKALAELNRVAEAVFIVYPSRQSLAGWLIPDHHLWVWQEGNTTYFKQRGKSESKNKAEYHI
ncbi:methyltransferase domain-containing protein [Chloroflexota bacterium]